MTMTVSGAAGVTYPDGSVAGSALGRNVVIDGGFTVNQRGYTSASTLSSGSYGHDRWKGGASGGDYSFTQLASPTTITIAASKSLIQVIEDKNVHATSYVLSWTGTAQGRYAVNSATPAGSYAASPIIIIGQTAGTTMSIEFNTGTLGKVQLEAGSAESSFETRSYGTELALCQRYYQNAGSTFTGYVEGTNIFAIQIQFKNTMRSAPSGASRGVGFKFAARYAGDTLIDNPTIQNLSSTPFDLWVQVVSSGLVDLRPVTGRSNYPNGESNFLALSAEL